MPCVHSVDCVGQFQGSRWRLPHPGTSSQHHNPANMKSTPKRLAKSMFLSHAMVSQYFNLCLAGPSLYWLLEVFLI